MAALQQYDWLMAIISIAFCGSSFGNGANDVANSYATAVAARTLTMPQVGFLSMVTEFVGAVALGSRVTGTIKNNIIDIGRFQAAPATIILAMTCAELASAAWLLFATKVGFSVSTTQTVVGALIGAGIAAQSQISWSWKTGSVSQIAASWGIAPCISAGFAAVLFATMKFCILERDEPLAKAMRAIPFYMAFTASVLALFITIEAPGARSLEELGAGTAVGIVLGVFGGMLALAYVFFMPYAHRRLVVQDTRIRARHIILGPLLWREDPPIFWPAKGDDVVIDYYGGSRQQQPPTSTSADPEKQATAAAGAPDKNELKVEPVVASDSSPDSPAGVEHVDKAALPPSGDTALVRQFKKKPEPEERFLGPTAHLPLYDPRRMWSWVKYIALQGVTRDCVTAQGRNLESVHGRAKVYDNRAEHLWTYAHVASAAMMSVAHGSNDVANAVGPWVGAYQAYVTGTVDGRADTPVFILIIAGFLLGAGFWFMGHHIVRAMGNEMTQMSPTRGFAMNMGAAITVLLASRLGLPVSTTQCIMGSVLGVSMMNMDARAVNWRQMAFIFSGWVLTLPAAGLVSGLMMAMALNTPHFT